MGFVSQSLPGAATASSSADTTAAAAAAVFAHPPPQFGLIHPHWTAMHQHHPPPPTFPTEYQQQQQQQQHLLCPPPLTTLSRRSPRVRRFVQPAPQLSQSLSASSGFLPQISHQHHRINPSSSATAPPPIPPQIPRQLFHPREQDPFERAYRVGPVLGKGGFGTVYAGIRNSDGVHVAIKQIAKSKITEWGHVSKKVAASFFSRAAQLCFALDLEMRCNGKRKGQNCACIFLNEEEEEAAQDQMKCRLC